MDQDLKAKEKEKVVGIYFQILNFLKNKKKRLENQDDPIVYRGKHGRLKTKEEVKTLQIEKILRNLEVDI